MKGIGMEKFFVGLVCVIGGAALAVELLVLGLPPITNAVAFGVCFCNVVFGGYIIKVGIDEMLSGNE